MASERRQEAAGAKPRKSKVASVVSGSMSGAAVSACVQPLDVLRTRMQADVAAGTYRSTLQTMQEVVRQASVGGAAWDTEKDLGLN